MYITSPLKTFTTCGVNYTVTFCFYQTHCYHIHGFLEKEIHCDVKHQCFWKVFH